MKSRIITREDEWNSLVKRSLFYDMYHMHSYSMLETTGRAVLFTVMDDDQNFIALPLVVRPVAGYQYNDVTSVYGYPGPVSSLHPGDVPEGLIRFFQEELVRFFSDSDIICAFSRLNPINNEAQIFFKDFGFIEARNKTVLVDLHLSEEQTWLSYREAYRRSIKKLERNGFEVRIGTTPEEIEKFTEVYLETMYRLNASSSYLFDVSYFSNLLAAEDINSTLLLIMKDGMIAAGVVLTTTNGIMQYHLGGTRSEYLKDAPMKLIVHNAIRIGKEKGLRYLHLGGGKSSSPDDPLLHFKKGFSDILLDFYTWRIIVDETAYNLINDDFADASEAESDYFPLYRRHIPAESLIYIPSERSMVSG